jgi:hypothetical protein
MTWYHLFGHLLWEDEASELFADHQEEAYDHYTGAIAGAMVSVKGHHFEASENGYARSLLLEGSGTEHSPYTACRRKRVKLSRLFRWVLERRSIMAHLQQHTPMGRG